MNTIQNKGVLWKVLQEKGYFNDIRNDHFNEIQETFEKTNETVSKTYLNVSLIEKNKKVIADMILYLKKMKEEPIYLKPPPPIQPIQLKPKNDIEKSLEKKKVEFLDLIHTPEPKEINFKDNQDEPIDGEINTLLEKAIQERENDLSFLSLEEKTENTIESITENTINKPFTSDTLSEINQKLNILINNQDEILKLLKNK